MPQLYLFYNFCAKGIPEEKMLIEFREIRQVMEKQGLFKPSYVFFMLQLMHIIALEVAAFAILHWCDAGWLPYLVAALILTTAQVFSCFIVTLSLG